MPDEFDEYDQRYREDPFDPTHSDTGGPRPWHPDRAAIKNKLKLPGILLILIGAVPLGLGVINAASWASGGMNEQVEEQIKQYNAAIDANPNIPAAQRQQEKDFIEKVMRIVLKYMPVILTVTLVGNLLVVIGGINMLRVSGHGLAVLGATMAMVPFMTCCCMAGVPIGLWALVTLWNKDVKAAFQSPVQLSDEQW